MSDVQKVKRPDITVCFDKERHLKYTLQSYAEMEERYGSVEASLDALSGKSIKAVIFILWCGLIHEDDQITEKAVGNMIDARDLLDCLQNITTAMSADTPSDQANTDAGEVVNPN